MLFSYSFCFNRYMYLTLYSPNRLMYFVTNLPFIDASGNKTEHFPLSLPPFFITSRQDNMRAIYRQTIFICPRVSRIFTNSKLFENGDLYGRTNFHEFNDGIWDFRLCSLVFVWFVRPYRSPLINRTERFVRFVGKKQKIIRGQIKKAISNNQWKAL